MTQETLFQLENESNSTLTHEEYLKKYFELRDKCEQIEQSITKRQKELSKKAGLDPELLGIHPHNAMVSYNAGKPWQGVNYDLVKEIVYLESHKWDSFRLLEKWSKKNDPFYTNR